MGTYPLGRWHYYASKGWQKSGVIYDVPNFEQNLLLKGPDALNLPLHKIIKLRVYPQQ